MNQPCLRRFHHKSGAVNQGNRKDFPSLVRRCNPPICDGASSPVKNLQPDLAERRLRRRGALSMLWQGVEPEDVERYTFHFDFLARRIAE